MQICRKGTCTQTMLRKTDENYSMILKLMFRSYEMLTNNSRLSNIENYSVELWKNRCFSNFQSKIQLQYIMISRARYCKDLFSLFQRNIDGYVKTETKQLILKRKIIVILEDYKSNYKNIYPNITITSYYLSATYVLTLGEHQVHICGIIFMIVWFFSFIMTYFHYDTFLWNRVIIELKIRQHCLY